MSTSGSALTRYFSPTGQNELRQEDYVAGRNVAGILIAVISLATFAGLGAVVWIALFAR
ncbi:MAG: hypothetical protein K8T25_05680 [Planctomycetia bacterium]|nr:hypothetical protein [Planctomycetia bacterium]